MSLLLSVEKGRIKQSFDAWSETTALEPRAPQSPCMLLYSVPPQTWKTAKQLLHSPIRKKPARAASVLNPQAPVVWARQISSEQECDQTQIWNHCSLPIAAYDVRLATASSLTEEIRYSSKTRSFNLGSGRNPTVMVSNTDLTSLIILSGLKCPIHNMGGVRKLPPRAEVTTATPSQSQTYMKSHLKGKKIKFNNYWLTDLQMGTANWGAFKLSFFSSKTQLAFYRTVLRNPFWRGKLQFGTNMRILPQDASKYLNSSKFPLEANHAATSPTPGVTLCTQTWVAPKGAPALSTLCGHRESLYPTAEGNIHCSASQENTALYLKMLPCFQRSDTSPNSSSSVDKLCKILSSHQLRIMKNSARWRH